ncbi:uncharacterized protein BT62DRAFT_921527 [Guyanagaster necrorhizus]|uniref:Uncharacterized protein n=1 Tax=Guyanagaster necrorhizus TaxID=856835 RepID=A0A9P7VNL1_9AGAR|nr:uncharacterized protein BT62DRAFT_921527 [Guyanagaster necrorhizus MCA 3950]KAG7443860.1 hypothetical protein BT62DRAFT_921527 [Guyanagaster necrorhizus MCA 3950]
MHKGHWQQTYINTAGHHISFTMRERLTPRRVEEKKKLSKSVHVIKSRAPPARCPGPTNINADVTAKCKLPTGAPVNMVARSTRGGAVDDDGRKCGNLSSFFQYDGALNVSIGDEVHEAVVTVNIDHQKDDGNRSQNPEFKDCLILHKSDFRL